MARAADTNCGRVLNRLPNRCANCLHFCSALRWRFRRASSSLLSLRSLRELPLRERALSAWLAGSRSHSLRWPVFRRDFVKAPSLRPQWRCSFPSERSCSQPGFLRNLVGPMRAADFRRHGLRLRRSLQEPRLRTSPLALTFAQTKRSAQPKPRRTPCRLTSI